MSQKQNSSQNWNISFTILNIDLMKKWKVGLIYELFTLNPLVDELHTIVLNNIIICKKKTFRLRSEIDFYGKSKLLCSYVVNSFNSKFLLNLCRIFSFFHIFIFNLSDVLWISIWMLYEWNRSIVECLCDCFVRGLYERVQKCTFSILWLNTFSKNHTKIIRYYTCIHFWFAV